MARAIIVVVDSFGIGHAPDAEKFGDVSANTFANLSQRFFDETQQAINIPNLAALGLVSACEQASNRTFPYQGGKPEQGAYGYAAELSTGKDTPSGHWEMTGVPVLFDWGYFSEPEPHLGGRKLACPRGKVIGGSSSINGMVYVRGHAGDYDNWSDTTAKFWSLVVA